MIIIQQQQQQKYVDKKRFNQKLTTTFSVRPPSAPFLGGRVLFKFHPSMEPNRKNLKNELC